MGYPVRAYRPSAPQSANSGSQSNSPQMTPGELRVPASLMQAANDNLPTPANDNFAGLSGAELDAAERVGLRALGSEFLHLAGPLGDLLTAYDLWLYFNGALAPIGRQGIAVVGMTHHTFCPGSDDLPSTSAAPNCAPIPISPTPATSWQMRNGFNVFAIYPIQHYGPNPAFILGVNSSWYTSDAGTSFPNTRNAYGYTPHVDFSPKHWPNIFNPPAPNPYPAINPDTVPATGVAPEPEPVPWPLVPLVPNSPFPQGPQRGYHAGNLDDPNQSRDNPPVVIGVGQLGGDRHRYQPPGRRQKERKFMVQPGAMNPVRAIFDAVTEGKDAIAAIFFALPPKARRLPKRFFKDPLGYWHFGQPTILDMLGAIYRNADQIDIKKALRNLVVNEATDYLVGRMGRANAAAVRAAWRAGVTKSPTTHSLSRRGLPQMAVNPIDWVLTQVGL